MHLLPIVPQLFFQNVLPPNFYAPDLRGLRVEQVIMRNLVKQKLPRIDSFLSGRQIDLSLVSIQWLVTLFAGVLPSLLLFRIWDVMLIRKRFSNFKRMLGEFKTGKFGLLKTYRSWNGIFKRLGAIGRKILFYSGYSSFLIIIEIPLLGYLKNFRSRGI